MTDREHDPDNRNCWCGPDLYVACPQCDGSEEGCWNCGNPYKGLVLADEEALADDERTLVIVHQV